MECVFFNEVIFLKSNSKITLLDRHMWDYFKRKPISCREIPEATQEADNQMREWFLQIHSSHLNWKQVKHY